MDATVTKFISCYSCLLTLGCYFFSCKPYPQIRPNLVQPFSLYSLNLASFSRLGIVTRTLLHMITVHKIRSSVVGHLVVSYLMLSVFFVVMFLLDTFSSFRSYYRRDGKRVWRGLVFENKCWLLKSFLAYVIFAYHSAFVRTWNKLLCS